MKSLESLVLLCLFLNVEPQCITLWTDLLLWAVWFVNTSKSSLLAVLRQMRSSVLAEASTSQSVHHLHNKTRSGRSKVTVTSSHVNNFRYKVLYLRFFVFFLGQWCCRIPKYSKCPGNRKAKNKACRNALFVHEYVTSTLLTKRPPSSFI